MNKKELTERDICTKFITPHIVAAGWDLHGQIREEVAFTDGRIYVRGKIHARGAQKRADYILYYKPNIPIAVIEAKDNKHSLGAGLQQALGYSDSLDVPFVFSSNGDGAHYAYAGYLMRLRFSADIWSPFVAAALASVTLREQIETPLRTTVGINNINSTEVSNLMIPVPPFAEQMAIVKRVDELKTSYRALETEIEHSRTHAKHLLQAVLKEAFAPCQTG